MRSKQKVLRIFPDWWAKADFIRGNSIDGHIDGALVVTGYIVLDADLQLRGKGPTAASAWKDALAKIPKCRYCLPA